MVSRVFSIKTRPHKIPTVFRLQFLVAVLVFVIVNRTVAQTSIPHQYKYTFTVAKDGTGDYKFIQEAIDAMRVYPLAPITLYIKNGVYNEKIELPANNTDVTFIGESAEKTIIKFNDYSGRGKLTTFSSYTAKISGNRFAAMNISFVNDAGRVGQAVALYVDADKALFLNCRFIGDQDTIFAAGETSRQLFKDCYIEGTTDFIFGPSTSVFQNCVIKEKANSYITAASTTPGKQFGFLFLDSKIIADSTVSKVFLGRPWRAHAKTVFIRCELPRQIEPAGWHNWGNSANEKTVLYAEYKNTGPGATNAKRSSWTKQLTQNEAAEYTLQNVFSSGYNKNLPGEDDWYLQKLNPFSWTANNLKN